MRLLIAILLFISLQSHGQIVRAHPLYRPPAVTASCTYPLDTYTGATGAYSVAFKLRSAYSGSAYRVRESGSNTEQDIGFVGCVVDTASLKSFCGSNSCYVVTLYDQEGSNNVTQSTAAAQARVVNAGTVERVSGQPSMYFDGGDFYNFSAFAGQTRMDFYFIQSTSDDPYVQFYAAGNQFGYVADGFCLSTLYSNFGTPSLYTNNSLQTPSTRCDVLSSLSGTKIVTIQNSTTSGWSNCSYGTYGGSFSYIGYLSIVIGWNSDQSSNRSGIVSAINTLYSIY